MSDTPLPPKPDDPVTLDELQEMLDRTPEEIAALDALADDPDAQALEALKQHLRHEAAAAQAKKAP